MIELGNAIERLDQFARSRYLTGRLAALESQLSGTEGHHLKSLLEVEAVTPDLLDAAVAVKSAAEQINVVIHAVGILLALPQILDPEEEIRSLSLGAGNTGRDFDLETDRRIAEFKFINWRGGAEAIRQNSVFVDLLNLALGRSGRRKYLYVLNREIPLRFLHGGRSIKSVLSRNSAAAARFAAAYGDRYVVVSQWYSEEVRGKVAIEDLSDLLPAFARAPLAETGPRTHLRSDLAFRCLFDASGPRSVETLFVPRGSCGRDLI